MDEFALMQLLMIPHWIISIIYFIAAVCIFSVRQVPLAVRISISLSVLITSVIYMFFYFQPTLYVLENRIYNLANVTVMLVVIIKAIFYIIERRIYGRG